MKQTVRGLAGQSGHVRGPAKGTAASTSSQPQAVGFVGRYLRPLGLPAYEYQEFGELSPLRYRFSMGCPASKSSSVRDTLSMKLSSRRCTPSSEATSNRATTGTSRSAPGAGTPAGDFWKRSGQHEPRRVPGHGAPSSKSSSMRHKPFNKAVPTRAATGTNRSAPGAGTPARRSGSEADSMSRGGHPCTGRVPAAKSSFVR